MEDGSNEGLCACNIASRNRQERESRRRKGDGRVARDEERESEMGDGDGGASVWRGFQGCVNVRANGVQPQEVKLQEAGQSKGRWISSKLRSKQKRHPPANSILC